MSRKAAYALTEEDMKIFHFKEPYVDLHLNYGSSTPTSGGNHGASAKEAARYKANQQYGLYSGIDSTTFHPTFSLEINMEDIFGKETVETRRKRAMDYLVYREQNRWRGSQSLTSLAPVNSNALPGSSLF